MIKTKIVGVTVALAAMMSVSARADGPNTWTGVYAGLSAGGATLEQG